MPGKFSLEEALSKLKTHVASRGADCMRGLGRAFRIVDENHNQTLDLAEFTDALQIWGMEPGTLTKAEIMLIMAHFDDDGDGMITYQEFIHGLRGKMNDRRMNMVRKAYGVLDSSGDGVVTLGDIMATYSVEDHPEVQQGKKTPEEVFKVFLDSFEGPHGDKDGTVTHEEWIDYYSNISCSIDNDDYFVLMMQNAWGLKEATGEFSIDQDRVNRLESQLRDKLLQKKKDSESETKCLLNAFKYFNLSGSNLVDLRAFTRTCERFGLVLSPAEMEAWFNYYAATQEGADQGHVNYEAFAHAVYPDDGVFVRDHGVATTPGRSSGLGSGDGLTDSTPTKWRPSTARVEARHKDTSLW